MFLSLPERILADDPDQAKLERRLYVVALFVFAIGTPVVWFLVR